MKDIVVTFTVLVSIVPVLISSISGLRCIECHYAYDPSVCRYSKICDPYQHCSFRQFFSEDGEKVYDLDCLQISDCPHKQFLPSFVGRKKRQTSVQEPVECCDTDLCNARKSDQSTAVSQTTLATTKTTANGPSINSNCQHEHKECTYLATHFSICNDTHVAKTICPKSCGRCTTSAAHLSTTTVTNTGHSMSSATTCSDHQGCDILVQNIDICSKPDVAAKMCPRICGICITTTTENHSDLITTSSQPNTPTSELKTTPTTTIATQKTTTQPITKKLMSTESVSTPTSKLLMPTTTGAAGCPAFPPDCPLGCASIDNNLCAICDYTLCTTGDQTTTEDKTMSASGLSTASTHSKYHATMSTSGLSTVSTPLKYHVTMSTSGLSTVSTPSKYHATTNTSGLSTGSTPSKYHVTRSTSGLSTVSTPKYHVTMSSPGLPTVSTPKVSMKPQPPRITPPVTPTPAILATLASTKATIKPIVTACPPIFCVLNCGQPPAYKKDAKGCDICACA